MPAGSGPSGHTVGGGPWCHLIELGSSSFLISGQGQGKETEGDSRSFPSISEPRVGPGGVGEGACSPTGLLWPSAETL